MMGYAPILRLPRGAGVLLSRGVGVLLSRGAGVSPAMSFAVARVAGSRALFIFLIGVLTMSPLIAAPRDYHFDGSISRPVLDNYLSRAVTMMDLLTPQGNLDDNIRMLKHTGVKYAGRVVYRWGGEAELPALLIRARESARKVHAADPEMILQAGVFEIVTRGVESLPVPDWVFREFGQPIEKRNFRYDAMLFPESDFRDHWGKDASVPDMRQLETRMWFYYAAANYIDIGCEAIHFGQVHLIGAKDKGWANWWDMLSRVRRYAKVHARRHLVLCDAHTHGLCYAGDKLLFDLHAYPLRIKDVPDRPQEGILEVGYLDTIFGKSAGGLTPSGWRCDALPYIVELDNWGASGKEGQHVGDWWTWGYDEISWFAHQPEPYRNDWLRYAWEWLREHDRNGHLQMPASRCLAAPVNKDISWYWANNRSPAVPTGFGQEDTIRSIWQADTP
jgi:hypothetical protein